MKRMMPTMTKRMPKPANVKSKNVLVLSPPPLGGVLPPILLVGVDVVAVVVGVSVGVGVGEGVGVAVGVGAIVAVGVGVTAVMMRTLLSSAVSVGSLSAVALTL